MPADALPPGAAAWLAGLGLRLVGAARLAGGRNNRVWRLETDAGPRLLKAYFHHPGDPRDRLGTEFAFLRYAWDHGVRSVPEPLAANPAQHLGLYEFVPGSAVAAHEVDESAVAAAMDLLRALNRHRHEPAARRLPPASTAAFSLPEHVALVSQRLARLAAVDHPVVQRELLPRWETLRAATAAALLAAPALAAPLAEPDWCLSPSDFGFHNALRQPDGTLRFLDFEYAGWDDPARVAADFLGQPDVPVPDRYAPLVEAATAGLVSDPELHRRRVALLRPLCRLRWACILLNGLLPIDADRRRFASLSSSDLPYAQVAALLAEVPHG